ncbi:MAG: hypothetical protein ACTS6G_03785 [Candidatus Hodgkinia cicadicola]
MISSSNRPIPRIRLRRARNERNRTEQARSELKGSARGEKHNLGGWKCLRQVNWTWTAEASARNINRWLFEVKVAPRSAFNGFSAVVPLVSFVLRYYKFSFGKRASAPQNISRKCPANVVQSNAKRECRTLLGTKLPPPGKFCQTN